MSDFSQKSSMGLHTHRATRFIVRFAKNSRRKKKPSEPKDRKSQEKGEEVGVKGNYLRTYLSAFSSANWKNKGGRSV